MAIAGKVAITLSTENGGAWSADVTYDRLVAVKHNNNLYISRKTVANVEPPNNEFWFLALEGFGGDDVQVLIDQINGLEDAIQEIIDGITQVGNAETLDGHGAEYFAPLERVKGQKMPTGTDLNNITEQGIYYFDGVATNYTNTPNATAHNGILTVDNYYWEEFAYAVCVQRYTSLNLNKTFERVSQNKTWKPWQEVFTTAGGTIEAPTPHVMGVKNTTGTDCYVNFNGEDGLLGYLGFYGNNPAYIDGVTKAMKMLLHTGNKPTGTYTGNGDATERTINIGGFGNGVIIYGSNYTMAVVCNGAICRNGSALEALVTEKAGLGRITSDVVMVLRTDNSALNANGVTYTYHLF